MEIEITKKEIGKTNLLSKLTLTLFGIFVTSLIFATSIKLFQEIGIWTGLAVTLITIFLGFYYTKKGSRLRIVTWSVLITLTAGIIISLVGIQSLSKLLEGF